MMPFTFPSHCGGCGAVLMAGATRHSAGCPIRQMIEEYFPGCSLPPPHPLPPRCDAVRCIWCGGCPRADITDPAHAICDACAVLIMRRYMEEHASRPVNVLEVVNATGVPLEAVERIWREMAGYP
jgi:hypothetical protein